MRSKSYVKDFNTGFEAIRFKDKPARSVRGVVTVELFDAATAKKTLEAKTENLITQAMRDHMLWDMKEDFFRGCPGTLPAEPVYPITHIALCTSSESEADERMPNFGEIIGWCNKSAYSGSDIRRGTINASESHADENMAHWVFDWPTHAGNGTFQTIMWLPLNESSALPSLTTTSVFYLWNTGYSGYWYDLAFDGQTVWICYSNSQTIYKKDKASGANILTINGPKAGHSGIAFDGQNLWVASYEYNQTPIVYKLSPTDGTILGSFNGPAKYCMGLEWDGSHLWYACGNKTIYELDLTNGSILSSFNVSYDPRGIAWDGQSLWLLGSGYRLMKCMRSGQMLASFIDVNGHAESGLAWDGQNLFSLSYSGNVYLYRFSNNIYVGARTLLASPITKTSTNTMKIQYDFIFEEQ